MSFNATHAVVRNRHWGAQLGWLPKSNQICTTILRTQPVAGDTPAFARAVQAYQINNSLDDDGIIGPRTWRRIKRRLALGPAGAAKKAVAPVITTGVASRRGFVFLPDRNEAKNEYRGAWKPAADRFCQMHGIANRFEFNPHNESQRKKRERRSDIIDAMKATPGPLQVIAYFGHGWTGGLASADFTNRHIDILAQAITQKAASDCVIIMYACSSARKGGFNEELAKAVNLPVYGHTTAGHASYNPHVKVYDGNGRDEFVVAPDDPLWGTWREALRNSDLWARFPFMSEDELFDELEARAG